MIIKIILLLLISINIFAYEYGHKFQKLDEEKHELINRYEIRVEVARIDRMYKRVRVLNKTLSCLKNSRSRQELMGCKADERRRIMKMIRG